MAPRPRIKVCGLTREEDIRLCVSAGVHALGFVVEYPVDVPWNLDRAGALALMRAVPPFVSRVIVVGGDPGTVVALTSLLKPHAVQLHGDEPLSVTAGLVAPIRACGAQVIKALRFSAETGRCLNAGDDPLEAACRIREAGVDAIVLDSVGETRPAGTGRTVDWRVARGIRDGAGLPVILAGGLNAGNVGRAIDAVDPYGVDVISGVEESAGQKDPVRFRAFIVAARGSRPARSPHRRLAG